MKIGTKFYVDDKEYMLSYLGDRMVTLVNTETGMPYGTALEIPISGTYTDKTVIDLDQDFVFEDLAKGALSIKMTPYSSNLLGPTVKWSGVHRVEAHKVPVGKMYAIGNKVYIRVDVDEYSSNIKSICINDMTTIFTTKIMEVALVERVEINYDRTAD